MLHCARISLLIILRLLRQWLIVKLGPWRGIISWYRKQWEKNIFLQYKNNIGWPVQLKIWNCILLVRHHSCCCILADDFGGRVYGNSLFFPNLLFLGTINHIFYIFYLEQISNKFLYSTNDTTRNISPAIRYECWHNRHGSSHDTCESSSKRGVA
jgi:hypothetical protein